ncbi:hypothetical protein ACIQZB_13160 [Streptomyces sp. NPDC097727]|uniref:hypothetical protein n=1 Tax=Streptomyces sp. NPDC097727 TaxID=3366092 RepID=UPI00382901EA
MTPVHCACRLGRRRLPRLSLRRDSGLIRTHRPAQSKAEFRKEAARTAELQAKAAADAATMHRDNAKKDKETAEAKLGEALKAEGDVKTAAVDAHAERLAAEAEEATAKVEKETASAKQAEAAQHKKNAETYTAQARNAE